jgi:recA bacterial DNA recombination protein
MNLRSVLPTAVASKLRTARELAADLRRAEEDRVFATACPALDRLLAGGLRRGGMVELVGRRSSGRFSLVCSVLAAVTGSGETAALVDLGDGFDPESAVAAGVDLERLLWARPRHLKEVLASAEAILQSGMPLVVIDLGMPPLPGGRGAEASWLRLARAAQGHRAALLVASPYRVSGTSAQAVLEARGVRADWLGQGAAPRLLCGVSARLALVKSRARHLRDDRPAVPAAARTGDAESLLLRMAEDLRGGPESDAVAPRADALEELPWRIAS